MDLNKLKLILRALCDDTRLRIVNLLNLKELTVKDICSTLEIKQPAVSKHLVRLRLLRIVNDRREKNFVYYSINHDPEQEKIIQFLLSEFSGLETFKKDREKLNNLKKEMGKSRGGQEEYEPSDHERKTYSEKSSPEQSKVDSPKQN